MRRVVYILLLVAIVFCASACSAREFRYELSPVYLLSADAGSSLKADQLISETAIKLTELQAGLCADRAVKYVPLDKLGDLAEDSWPRIQIRLDRNPVTANYMRIVRKGDQWLYYSSYDGENFDLVGRHILEMPQSCFVGAYLCATSKGKIYDAHVNYISINGEKLTQPQLHFKEGGSARIEDDGIYLHAETNEYTDKLDNATLAGQTVEGDFTLEACFEPYSKDSDVMYSGILCRQSPSQPSPSIMNYYNATWTAPAYRQDEMKSALAIDRSFYPKYRVMLKEDSASEYREICRDAADFSSWQELVNSSERLAAKMQKALSENIDIRFYDLPKPVPTTEAQRAKLASALKKAREEKTISALYAARDISDVLNENPTISSAWIAAAMCEVVPTLNDLAGWFHHRDRYLAGPLSKLLFARRLLAAEEAGFADADLINESYVMLACGYPAAADKNSDRLQDKENYKNELLALKIFATDNYTLVGDMDMSGADPYVTVAWQRALARCERYQLLYDFGLDRAEQARADIFVPTKRANLGIGYGHQRSEMGISLTAARDIRDILLFDGLSMEKKKEIISKDISHMAIDSSMEELSNLLAWQAMRQSGRQTFKLLTDLLMYAKSTSADTVCVDENMTVKINVLSLRDYADLRLGNFINRLNQRLKFVGDSWGVDDYAIETADDYIDVFNGRINGLVCLYEFYKSYVYAKPEEAKEKAEIFSKTDFSKILSSRWEVFNRGTRKYTTRSAAGAFKFFGGRGAWVQELNYLNQPYHGGGSAAVTNAIACNRIAPYSMEIGKYLSFYKLSPEYIRQIVAIAPYNIRALRVLSNITDDKEEQIRLLESRIELAPGEYSAYTTLGCIYLEDEKIDLGIEKYRQAIMNCSFTVGLSNALGTATNKLVKLDRIEEALEFGQYARRSGSALAELAYARALEKAERNSEAGKIFRRMAVRYRSCVDDYFRFMLRRDFSDDLVVSELKAMTAEHPAYIDKTAYNCMWHFRSHRTSPELIDALMTEVFSEVDLESLSLSCVVGYMAARDFDRAVSFCLRLQKENILTAYQAYWAYYAARLIGREEAEQVLLAELQQYKDDKIIAKHIKYINGEISADELKEQTKSDSMANAYTYWTFGMEAEIAGDMDSAFKHYRSVIEINADSQTNYLSRCWTKDRKAASEDE